MLGYTQSYVSGPSNVELIGDTIGEHFDKAVGRWGSEDALVIPFQNICWNWNELKKQVDNMAKGLIQLGLKPGDRIGIWSPNNKEWVLTQFATAKAGLILVNINPAYRLSELEFAINKVECKALITASKFKTSDYISMISELAPEVEASQPGELQAKKIPSLRNLIQIGEKHSGMFSFEDILEVGKSESDDSLNEIGKSLQFDDPINIQFTSGTTGTPKGATLTHHNILNNGFFIGEKFGLSEKDRMCIPVPLYHCFGMVIGNLACMTHGTAMVYPSESFEASATLETIENHNCTCLLYTSDAADE